MDINKWKSVAVKKETHTNLTALCNEKERNPARMISKLVNDYITFQAEKKGISREKYLSNLMQKMRKNGSKQK
jgi:1-aminocyclopropane-1-carboxylate deaminase/D-cysteine desulfhydrase-like pyridoxal-dependent ACC family enzyme|tara:strand:+ start:851 stop:1069 length:219 start_codon:yes stop_codon:yes gene_type:complete